MPPSARLGGFKVLKDVVQFSLAFQGEKDHSPAEFFRVIAEGKINLPYITSINYGHSWGLNIVVETSDERTISHLIDEAFGNIFQHDPKSAILSIFPHKKNPGIPGYLLEVFGQEGLKPGSLANSPSAISVVLREEQISKASSALFEPFSFSAYRTPADWKLAQKGKEQLYKEVVASYQEQRPKVYGLEYHEGQEFVQVLSTNWDVGHTGSAFKEFARRGLYLTFLATGPCQEGGREKIVFCLPSSKTHDLGDIINKTAPNVSVESTSPVTVFSMNGPHFGDRYGIVSDLLASFEKNETHLLGLGCTIASITGVVHSHQLESAVQAIQECFEVPSITKKD
jgi:aspartokinase